jgi:hypothetical protein
MATQEDGSPNGMRESSRSKDITPDKDLPGTTSVRNEVGVEGIRFRSLPIVPVLTMTLRTVVRQLLHYAIGD